MRGGGDSERDYLAESTDMMVQMLTNRPCVGYISGFSFERSVCYLLLHT